jgi:hypothetical protein
MKTTTVLVVAIVSAMSVMVGAILMIAGNPFGDYMVVAGAITGTASTSQM